MSALWRWSYTGAVDRLEQLREDLWNRWREAFGRLADLDPASLLGERVVYANVPLFKLKNYTPRKFPAGGRIFLNLPETPNSYYVYRLDSKGRPVHAASRHAVNNIRWEGFYRYTSDEVEYVEFCLQTAVVSEYARITMQNGLLLTYQNIDINGGGARIGGRTGKSAMDHIAKNSYFYWIQIEQYEASEDRIAAGRALVEGAGLSPQRSALEYSYSDAGRLGRIVRIHESGSKTTEFAAKSKLGMRELATRLSKRIAARAIEALRKANFSAPLLAVEMSFRSVTNYVPFIIPATARDYIPNLVLPTAIDPRNWISLSEEDFEPEMAEFLERMSSAEKWDHGSRMLRQAARMITHQGPDSFMVDDYFVAFAIDWEFEGQELPKILKQCGANAATLRKLKKIGWLE
jgi:hypothetical protein